MPIGFLTTADRDRLNRFPAQMPEEDLRAFFLLSEDDQRVIQPAPRGAYPSGLCAPTLCPALSGVCPR